MAWCPTRVHTLNNIYNTQLRILLAFGTRRIISWSSPTKLPRWYCTEIPHYDHNWATCHNYYYEMLGWGICKCISLNQKEPPDASAWSCQFCLPTCLLPVQYCFIFFLTKPSIASWLLCVRRVLKEKVYITPSPMRGGLHNPPTYKTIYITPWTFQNRSNYPLKQFWNFIVNHRKNVK